MDDYPKCIQEALNELKEQKKAILKYVAAGIVAEKACELFSDSIKDIKTSLGYSVLAYKGALIMCHIDSMALVVPLLQWLAKMGYPKKGKPEDDQERKRRSWNCGDITVMVFLPWEDGANCNFVQVGTEEKAIYELQCKE